MSTDKVIVEINNPSKLIMDIDALLKLSPQSEESIQKERDIYAQLGARKTKNLGDVMMVKVDCRDIERRINDKYSDGFDAEDELSSINYPYYRSLRKETTKIDDPTIVKKSLSADKISSLTIGNYHAIANRSVVFRRHDASILALSNPEVSRTR